MKTEPMYANCTRYSVRTSTLAPESSSSVGLPGTGPKIRTGTPEVRPPSATVAAPLSAPFASSAITGALLVELGGRLRDDLAPGVETALRAHAVGQLGRVALRAGVQPRRRDLVLRPALVG